jgi:hypothetical protein
VDADITDVDCEDKFNEALRIAGPSLVQFLEHFNVRSAAVSALENLSKHGKLQRNSL